MSRYERTQQTWRLLIYIYTNIKVDRRYYLELIFDHDKNFFAKIYFIELYIIDDIINVAVKSTQISNSNFVRKKG